MGNYGVSDKLNFVWHPLCTNTMLCRNLHGLNGMQDLSLWVKWNPIETKFKGERYLYMALAGLSSLLLITWLIFCLCLLALHSTNLSLRGMVDYQVGKWFATASGTYVVRSNIKIDRNYTIQQSST